MNIPATKPLTISQMLMARAEQQRHDPLFICGEVRRDGQQMVDAAGLAGGVLRDEGIGPGDTVALMSTNRVELMDFILGCAWIGAIAVPINVASRGEQLQHILTNCAATLVISEAEFVPHILAIAPLPNLKKVWLLDPMSEAPSSTVTIVSVPETRTQAAPADSTPGDTAAILYTSGTTGVSKGVECPHGQFYWWGVNMADQLMLTEDDVLYTNLPLFHTNALNAFMQAVVCGGSFVLGPKFSASKFWTNLRKSQATVTYLLGAMVSILARHEPSPADRDHRVRIALSPATPPALHEQFRQRFGVLLLDGYGSTETNSVIGSTPLEWKAGMMGRVRPGFQIRVVDEFGGDVSAGTPGELLIRSTQRFAVATGYYKMPEATVKAWQDLWFHTGDRVVEDEQGWLRFVDRIKDVIRRRGENISSVEVESALRQHPAVMDAAVYAVDSELSEDEVMAALVVSEQIDFTELRRFLTPLLSSFAIPRFLRVVAALPQTENGKVRKEVLKKEGRDAAQWDSDAVLAS